MAIERPRDGCAVSVILKGFDEEEISVFCTDGPLVLIFTVAGFAYYLVESFQWLMSWCCGMRSLRMVQC